MLWYDLETFGRNPKYDRIAQFAALRTDYNLNPVEDPLVLYCRLTPDYLPDPQACIITGITPETVQRSGLRERDFANRVHQELSRPGTCIVGYNNIKFDDEFIRNLFYRNFIDPYAWHYANGNSRWDLINVVRLAHDLRPDGITWPTAEDGRPLFKLDHLTAANGIEHRGAHDALADVYATIAMAQLVRSTNPRLYQFAWDHRSRDKVRSLLDIGVRRPVLHTDGIHTRQAGCTTAVAPVGVNPENPKAVIAADLRYDPTPIIELPTEEVRRRIFTSSEILAPEQRIHVTEIHENRSPVLTPVAALDPESSRRLDIDIELCTERARMLYRNTLLIQKFQKVYGERPARETPEDPELMIYGGGPFGGFFADEDKKLFEAIRHAEPGQLLSIEPKSHDQRIPVLFRRYVWRNAWEALDQAERDRYRAFCAKRLLQPPVTSGLTRETYEKRIKQLWESPGLDARGTVVLKSLRDYGALLDRSVFQYRSE
ncbi:exonuclease I [Spirochaeta africana DSM 8902]|uniref:Exodeoxyribonuclease I n=2 Tax=Spirochaeta TaxID=146 RepID=H9UIL4_SPIAZ|nr:exonuclease I [Spirochaeta africana DSM 8902]